MRNLAAGLSCHSSLQLGRQLVGLVGWEAELGEAVVRHVESGLASAAVDDHADGDWICAVLTALFERFNDATAASDDVFNDQHLLVGREFEVAAQFELIIDFFEKNEAQAELARHLLANHEAAHSWAHDRSGA